MKTNQLNIPFNEGWGWGWG